MCVNRHYQAPAWMQPPMNVMLALLAEGKQLAGVLCACLACCSHSFKWLVRLSSQTKSYWLQYN
jgi:hypothetical protein